MAHNFQNMAKNKNRSHTIDIAVSHKERETDVVLKFDELILSMALKMLKLIQ